MCCFELKKSRSSHPTIIRTGGLNLLYLGSTAVSR